MNSPVDRLNKIRRESRAAKLAIWNRLQIEEPGMAAFMQEAKRVLGARAVEIKLNGKTVWEKK